VKHGVVVAGCCASPNIAERLRDAGLAEARAAPTTVTLAEAIEAVRH
jgi:heterodisulfide reductase subunit A-like polyferredoxin